MASYLDKTQVNTALTNNTKLDLGHQHISTADFMQLNVATIMELVPGSKIDVKMESFARLNPLPVPTFGRASMRNRAFFVPFRTIYRGWNDFITDSVHVASDGYSVHNAGSLLSRVPTVSMDNLVSAFVGYVGTDVLDGSGMVYQVSSSDAWDLVYTTGGATAYYCYTVKGRQCLKLVESLGYKLDWTASKDVVLSALPLLALAKVFVDWYYPQQYSNRLEYDILQALCNYDVSMGPLQLTAAQVNTILSLCAYVQYDSDLFVSAWDTPNQPNAGNYSDFKLVNIDSIGQVYGNNLYTILSQNGVTNNSGNASSNDALSRYGKLDAPFITGYLEYSNGSSSVVATGGISEYLLHSLHALTDYMKRHQLAGSRAFDRYLARFGKALPAEKMNRSLYLGAAMQDIQIGDIMSTSDTASSGGDQLGSFAGKGISYGNGHFDYDTDEFGYFIVLSSIVPATGYFQGIDPLTQRISKLQFFTPEFDSLGSQPIEAANLFIPQVAGQMSTGDAYEQVFGFVPRYADYKAPTCMDRLTGNFRLPSLQGNALGHAGNAADSWHLLRSFAAQSDFSGDYANVVHSPQFINGGADFSQYKRIFYLNKPESPDNFTIIHNFEIAEYAPMKSLYDSYEFEDKGKKVTLETNGVKMN